MDDADAIDDEIVVAEVAVRGDGLNWQRNQTFDTGNIFNFLDYCH